MMEENVGLKYRLSEVLLKQQFDKPMLMDVENYQTHFLQEDQLIHLLRNDIAVLNKQLHSTTGDDALLSLLGGKLNMLRKDISLAEMQFNQLKADFSNYLLRNNLLVRD